MRGGVSNEIQTLRQKLLDFASLIELELDFGEEDVEFADRKKLKALVKELVQLTTRLKNTFHVGHAIKEGIPTVIAGRPNAGKSTILNKLLQEERAIGSPIAGTTRDTIEEILVIDGIQFRLVDTAGIREAHDEIETIGIQRTMEKIQQATILIYVFDVTETVPDEVKADIESIGTDHATVILVANKMDLNPYALPDHWKVDDHIVVPLSALNNMNIPYLLETIGQTITKNIPQDIPVISSLRHYHALERTEERLRAVFMGLGGDKNKIASEKIYMPTENWELSTVLLAQDVRQALYHLGTITGEISTEDVLGNIFGRFCIGK
jgi:tRNA modification GTPase